MDVDPTNRKYALGRVVIESLDRLSLDDLTSPDMFTKLNAQVASELTAASRGHSNTFQSIIRPTMDQLGLREGRGKGLASRQSTGGLDSTFPQIDVSNAEISLVDASGRGDRNAKLLARTMMTLAISNKKKGDIEGAAKRIVGMFEGHPGSTDALKNVLGLYLRSAKGDGNQTMWNNLQGILSLLEGHPDPKFDDKLKVLSKNLDKLDKMIVAMRSTLDSLFPKLSDDNQDEFFSNVTPSIVNVLSAIKDVKDAAGAVLSP
jgi:hypothetical protein